LYQDEAAKSDCKHCPVGRTSTGKACVESVDTTLPVARNVRVVRASYATVSGPGNSGTGNSGPVFANGNTTETLNISWDLGHVATTAATVHEAMTFHIQLSISKNFPPMAVTGDNSPPIPRYDRTLSRAAWAKAGFVVTLPAPAPLQRFVTHARVRTLNAAGEPSPVWISSTHEWTTTGDCDDTEYLGTESTLLQAWRCRVSEWLYMKHMLVLLVV